MNAMVERVAKTLCNEHGWYSWDDDFDEDANNRGNLTKDDYRGFARAAIAALREPSEEMWGGLARQIVLWCRFQRPTGADLHGQLEMTGASIPEWLAKEIPCNDHVPPKGTVAVCIFKAMIDSALEEK